MSYVVVIERNTVVTPPLASFADGLEEATRRFGGDVEAWMELNVRVEEVRH